MRTIKVENGAAASKRREEEEEPLVKIKKEAGEDHRKELTTQVIATSQFAAGHTLASHLGHFFESAEAKATEAKEEVAVELGGV